MKTQHVKVCEKQVKRYKGTIKALRAYVRKTEGSEINILSFYNKKLEKEAQIIFKASRRK